MIVWVTPILNSKDAFDETGFYSVTGDKYYYRYLSSCFFIIQSSLFLLLKNLVISFIQFVIAQVCISLCNLYVAMPCKFLREFEVTRATQDCGDEVMPEGVGSDLTNRVLAQNFPHTVCDDISPRSSGDGLDLFTRTFVVTGEEGQGP